MNIFEVRAFLLGFVGLALSFYSLTNGQAEWTIGVNGPFASFKQVKIHPYLVPSGQKLMVGLGVIPSLVSGALSACLMAGVLAVSLLKGSKKMLLLPPLVYTISELVKDVSTSVVTSLLIYAKFGNPAALVYILFSYSMIVFNAYLWCGALQLYEHHSLQEDLAEYEKKAKRPKEPWQISNEQSDTNRNESLGTQNLALKGPNNSLIEEFEEFKRKEQEKYKIQTTKNSFIESLSDVDSEISGCK